MATATAGETQAEAAMGRDTALCLLSIIAEVIQG